MRKFLVTACLALVAFAACKKDNSNDEPAPQPALETSVAKLDFTSAAGEKSFDITANVAWTVSIPAGNDWCTVSPANGNGNQKITVSLAENKAATARNLTLTVTADKLTKTVTIAQAAAAGTVSASEEKIRFTYKGENKVLTVTSNTNWAITCDAPWLTIGTASGDGNKVVSLSAPQNTTTSRRRGTITITPLNGTATTIKIDQLPWYPGRFALEIFDFVTVHDVESKATGEWTQYSTSRDITETYCSDAHPGWTITNEQFVYSLVEGAMGDEVKYSLSSKDNGTLCYQVITRYDRWSSSGKVKFHFEYNIERDRQEEQWIYTDNDVAITPWGQPGFIMRGFDLGKWKIHLLNCCDGGGTKIYTDYGSYDYFTIVREGNSIVVTIKPESEIPFID